MKKYNNICGTYVSYMVTYSNKTKSDYNKVSIPKEMKDEIVRIIETDKTLGFASIQEFVKDAVRKSIILYQGTNIELFPKK